MKIKTFYVCAALCLAAQGLPPALSADGGDEVLAAHPMPLYPGCVPARGNGGPAFLTKDALGAVRKYFEARLKPGDRIEPLSGDGETGFSVIYARKSGKRELTALEVSAAERTEKRPPHQAFGELNAQVSAGRHKQEELDALLKEYGDIDSAYFRAVSGAGRAGDEGELITARADREAHPDQDKLKAAGRKSKVSDGDKAEARELKKKMKELKAKGDFAGMMALAQNSKKFQAPPEGQAEAARMAAADRALDTWDIWVKCLKDTRDAAYRTRINYAAGTLP